MATANANVKKVLDSLKSKGTIVEEWHDGSEWYWGGARNLDLKVQAL